MLNQLLVRLTLRTVSLLYALVILLIIVLHIIDIYLLSDTQALAPK